MILTQSTESALSGWRRPAAENEGAPQDTRRGWSDASPARRSASSGGGLIGRNQRRQTVLTVFTPAVVVFEDTVPLAVVITLFATLLSSPALAENFLVIVADDLGVDRIAVYSRDDLYGHPGEGANPGPTPHIDQLAAEGVLFRYAYANSQCSPTRAATLTGRHGFRTGVGAPEGAFLDLAETTLAELVGSTHETAAIGKWHIGAGDIDHPIESGFDSYAGRLANLSDYYSWRKTTNSTITAGSTENRFSTYVTTDNGDEAIAKIAEFGENPWFIWLAFTAPHSPFHVPPDELTTLAVDENSNNTTKFKAAIEAMDTEIGRVLASVPEDVLDDTTIIFLGDNGTPGNVTESPTDSARAKGTLYEGGVRVPFIVSSPRISSSDQGRESLALINSTDIFTTVAELAGVPATAEDSLSIVPYLENPGLGTQRSCAYVENFSPNGAGPYNDEQRAARNDTYKLIWRNGTYEEFFDLVQDPLELDNLLLVSGLDPEQASAYSTLADAMENGSCAISVTQVVPELNSAMAAVLVLAALGGIAFQKRNSGRSVAARSLPKPL